MREDWRHTEEVPQPVVGSSESLGENTNVLVEHLWIVNPWGTVPGWCIKCSPEVEEEHGRDTTWAELSIWLRVIGGIGDGNVGTNIPQAQWAANSADDEKKSSTEMVNQVKKPNECNSGLDNSKDASGEQAGVCAGDTNRAEDGRGVVVWK